MFIYIYRREKEEEKKKNKLTEQITWIHFWFVVPSSYETHFPLSRISEISFLIVWMAACWCYMMLIATNCGGPHLKRVLWCAATNLWTDNDDVNKFIFVWFEDLRFSLFFLRCVVGIRRSTTSLWQGSLFFFITISDVGRRNWWVRLGTSDDRRCHCTHAQIPIKISYYRIGCYGKMLPPESVLYHWRHCRHPTLVVHVGATSGHTTPAKLYKQACMQDILYAYGMCDDVAKLATSSLPVLAVIVPFHSICKWVRVQQNYVLPTYYNIIIIRIANANEFDDMLWPLAVYLRFVNVLKSFILTLGMHKASICALRCCICACVRRRHVLCVEESVRTNSSYYVMLCSLVDDDHVGVRCALAMFSSIYKYMFNVEMALKAVVIIM